MKAAFLAMAVLATAGVAFYFSTTVNAGAGGTDASAQKALASKSRSKSRTMSPAKAISLPLFFEPNQGQTAPQVKFLARGAGYGLFLTADEAVLKLQHSAVSRQPSVPSSVIRMRLDGANSSAHVSGAEPLPGKSNYFIGNDPAKWRHNIPQFARVEYKSVYPGVDLVYYGDQGQLEYDFRVAPAADPNRIALSFTGASTRIESGDLILATDQGDVRFHAPRIYQQDGNAQKPIAGSFRQLADNKIGFTIGDYDRSRELVIDPVLNYSTYFGNPGANGGQESSVNLAVDSSGYIYLAGATTSNDFYDLYPSYDSPAFQPCLGQPGVVPVPPATCSTSIAATNVFIAVINPNPPSGSGISQLLYATYLGGSGTDSPAGIAVSTNVDSLMKGIDIYVAGTTSSANFPVSTTASGGLVPFQSTPEEAGTHGFVARLNVSGFDAQDISTLRYSTYLSGNGSDNVTGLAIDVNGDAYVTGVTTSTDAPAHGFPANDNGFQTQSNSPGIPPNPPNPQFFASVINTKPIGSVSMTYSTYFGGANFNGPLTVVGGGIAVDPPPNSAPNMYITGETNYLPGTSGGFPLFNAQQSCLDEASNHGNCTLPNPKNANGFVAKINPNPDGYGANPLYSTYIGGTGVDAGIAIAVDSTGNAYITGSTRSSDWQSVGSGFQTQLCNKPNGSGCTNAFIAKIGNQTGSYYPLTYFSYLGGTGVDVGNAIQVDPAQAVRVVGTTDSSDFPVTSNTYQSCLGEPNGVPPLPPPPCTGDPNTASNAFVALIGTSLAGKGTGDYVTYLGGSGPDEGTGVAIDPVFGATYVAGTTQSPNFPTQNPYQATLNGSVKAAFVSTIGAYSKLTIAPSATSPAPNPVPAGTQAAFTFEIGNNGPDTASEVIFTGNVVPSTGLTGTTAAKVTTGTGSCSVQGATVTCILPTLIVCTTANCSSAAVEVDVTPAIPATIPQITVAGQVTANNNNSFVAGPISQTDPIVDFTVTVSPSTAYITAGDTATFQVAFCPTGSGYNAPITPSQTTSPSIVTASTPTFVPTPVTPGSSCGTTILRIPTVARPVTTSSVFRRGSFYAGWLPIAGLSLVSLGIGAGRKRRRWLAGVVLGLIAGAILLQSGCGSSGSSINQGGGTIAGTYIITISGSAGTGASHSGTATLIVS
jgi:hypothetical protein